MSVPRYLPSKRFISVYYLLTRLNCVNILPWHFKDLRLKKIYVSTSNANKIQNHRLISVEACPCPQDTRHPGPAGATVAQLNPK